jgi:alanine-glyoxylate transaminase/serine-glyoxylate transaminase/serine-pyruvate transaminase
MSDSAFVFDPPTRILLGPGPSEVPPRVLAALARPTVGYLDPSYTALMEELQPLMRMLFQTDNEATFAITGAGTAAMEAAVLNAIEPGDNAVVCVHGYFGDRMSQIMERAGANVHRVEAPWGEPIEPSKLAEALAAVDDVAVVGVIHGETSTGVEQDVASLATLAREHGALTIADTVASLGGVEFRTDDWGVDIVYTGSQKCLSVPPGISPITFNARAMEKIAQRKTPCRSWYLDAELNLSYWRTPHKYHHTGPINLSYALYEGLRLVDEEGIQQRWARTRATAEGLWLGLAAMGLSLVVDPAHRLATLTTVRAPEGIDEAKVRGFLMAEHGIEIAGGLGVFAGQAWRVGLMGASCQQRHVLLLLTALEAALQAQGSDCPKGAGAAAAAAHFARG